MVNKNGVREPFLLMVTMNRPTGVAREMVCVLSPQGGVTRSGMGRAAAHLGVGRQ